MACKVNNVYAPNGSKSKLYADLVKQLKDESQALQLWMATRSPEFTSVYGDWRSEDFDQDLLDKNNEPLAKDILKPEYLEDVEFMAKAAKAAEDYQETAERMKAHKSKMHDTLVRKIEELKRNTTEGSKKLKTKLESLQRRVKSLDWREAATSFAAASKRNVSYAADRIYAELEKPEPNPRQLAKFNNYLKAFDVLETMRDEIASNPEMAETMEEELDMIDKVIRQKNAASTKYKNFMEKRISNKLSALSDKHSAEEVRKFLKRAPFDVTNGERWLLFAGDSKDAVISLVAKLVNSQQQKTRRASIEFTRKLSDKVEALNKERAQHVGNAEAMYGPMLERDSNGKLTGHFVHPKKSKQQYEAFKAKYEGTALFEFYEFFLAEYDRLNKYLPAHSNMEHRLPTIMKSTIERVLNSENKFEQMKAHARNRIEASNTDTERGEMTDAAGEIMNTVPIHFTQTYDSAIYNARYRELIKKGISEFDARKEATNYAMNKLPEDISYDLGASLQAFQYMAENYANMTEIIDVVEGAKDAVYERDVVSTDSKGKALINKLKGVDDNTIKIKGSESNAYKLIESYIAAQVYGQTEVDLGNFQIANMQIDTRKLLKNLQAHNSVVMLGGNLLAGLSNIQMGETMQWAEAFGGEFYRPKHYMKASAEYTRSLPGILRDTTERTPKSKIGLINEYFDVLGDYHPDGVGATNGSAVRRAAKSGSLFFINSAGEHMMQSRAAMAVLMATKVYDADGKETGTLWDAIDTEDGEIRIVSGTYTKKGNTLTEFGTQGQDAISRQIQYMLRKMHGNYNKQTAAAWQRNAYFGLIGQFRKWVADGFDRRWGKESYNEFADKDTEGSYRSTSKFVANLLNKLPLFNIESAKDWDSMTDHQKANVRRTAFELSVVIGTAVGLAVLKQLASNLDEEKDRGKLAVLRGLMYLVNRLFTELMFFVNPLDAWQILKSPAASMSVIQQTATTLKYGLPWNWSEKYEAGVNKGESRFLVSLGKQIPLWKQIERTSPDGIKGQLEFFNVQ